jgi:hypothetical protein
VDKARAHQLLANAGALGAHVTLVTFPGYRYAKPEAKQLRDVGFDVTVKALKRDFWAQLSDPRSDVALATIAWNQDFPYPSSVLDSLLDPRAYNGSRGFDPKLASRIDAAMADKGLARWRTVEKYALKQGLFVPVQQIKDVVWLGSRIDPRCTRTHAFVAVDIYHGVCALHGAAAPAPTLPATAATGAGQQDLHGVRSR